MLYKLLRRDTLSHALELRWLRKHIDETMSIETNSKLLSRHPGCTEGGYRGITVFYTFEAISLFMELSLGIAKPNY